MPAHQDAQGDKSSKQKEALPREDNEFAELNIIELERAKLCFKARKRWAAAAAKEPTLIDHLECW